MQEQTTIHYKLEEELIKINLNVDTQEELIRTFGDMIVEKGYAKKEYTQALLEREVEFPTGLLAAGNIGVAIPHTDAKYVNETAIAVGILDKGIPFEFMGCEDGTVDVQIVFVLAISDASAHLTFLQKLMAIFQNEVILTNLKNTSNVADVIEILRSELI